MAISSTRLLSRKQSISVRLEGTPGTIETATFKSFPCYEISCTPEIGFIERDLFTSSLAPEQTDAVGTQFARVTFKVDAMGAGAFTRPQWTEALFGCGLRLASAASVNAGTFDGDGTGKEWNVFVPENVPAQFNSVITESSHVCKTVTIKWWSDGRLYTLAGAAGNVSFSGTAGDLCYANFEFLGILTVTIEASDPAETFDSVTPTALSQNDRAFWTLYDADNDPAVRLSTWELNLNNSYDIYKDINKEKAGRFCSITERKPTLTTTTLAFDGLVADLLIQSMLDVDTGDTENGGYFQQQVGVADSGVGYDNLWFGCRKGQITSLDTGDENGYMVENATSKLIAGGSSDANLPTDREFYLAYGADLEAGFTMKDLNFANLSLT
jgi:hypothetical protein